MAMAVRRSSRELIYCRDNRGHLVAIKLGKSIDQCAQALRHVLGFRAQRFAKALADTLANSIGVDVVDLNIGTVAVWHDPFPFVSTSSQITPDKALFSPLVRRFSPGW
jgi:hypothetical protein